MGTASVFDLLRNDEEAFPELIGSASRPSTLPRGNEWWPYDAKETVTRRKYAIGGCADTTDDPQLYTQSGRQVEALDVRGRRE